MKRTVIQLLLLLPFFVPLPALQGKQAQQHRWEETATETIWRERLSLVTILSGCEINNFAGSRQSRSAIIPHELRYRRYLDFDLG